MKLFSFLVFLLGLITVTATGCKTFEEIYGSGQAVCEQLWGDSFTYETNESAAYTMWWSYGDNPNPGVSAALGHDPTHSDTCHLQYFHKEGSPSPEGEHMKECHPWKDNACCHNTTVETPEKMNTAYGEGYRWDRCGKLSQSCERFMVAEACFYECEPEAGLYREFHPISGLGQATYNESDDSHNTWSMHGMPIKASYCDAWYLACKYDKFCSPEDGTPASFFSCNANYVPEVTVVTETVTKDREGWLIIGVICLVVLFFLMICVCVLVKKEQNDNPMFAPLKKENDNAN